MRVNISELKINEQQVKAISRRLINAGGLAAYIKSRPDTTLTLGVVTNETKTITE